LFAPVQAVSLGALVIAQVPPEPQAATRQGFPVLFVHDATVQQTLSVQNTCPDAGGAQSAAVVHVPPRCCPVPQWLVLLQTLPPEQSDINAQLLLQAFEVALHAYGLHEPAVPGALLTLQFPAPSHHIAGVKLFAFGPVVGHDAPRHGVFLTYFSQPPLPSQLPSLPHVDWAALPHWPVVSALPGPMGVHVPSTPARVHETQAPSQMALQQTPSFAQTRPVLH
jgi:hypothetical protein